MNEFDCPLIWSIEQIVEDNLKYREDEDYKNTLMPVRFFLCRKWRFIRLRYIERSYTKN